MTAVWDRYEALSLTQRLTLIVAAAVLINAIYCLAYTHAAGHPSTVSEALAWGTINLAPWIAAIEIGRHHRRVVPLMLLLVGAGLVSLALEAIISGSLPTSFDLVRRVPGALVAALSLLGFAFFQKSSTKPGPRGEVPPRELSTVTQCSWVRSAGNYVEVHSAGNEALLVRSSLALCVGQRRLNLVRIHRSYAVARDRIAQVERAYVKLTDGTRLPIGDRFRDGLIPFE